MKLTLSCLLWVATFCLYAVSGIAETFNCDAVDELATVYSNSAVSIEEDRNNKTCKFSVGGATSKDAVQGRAENLQALMRDYYYDPVRRLDLFRRPDTAKDFVTMLLGAANATGQLPKDVLRKLDETDSKRALDRCFEAAARGGNTVSEQSTRNQVKCSVTPVAEAGAGWRSSSPRLLNVEVESASMRWILHLPLP